MLRNRKRINESQLPLHPNKSMHLESSSNVQLNLCRQSFVFSFSRRMNQTSNTTIDGANPFRTTSVWLKIGSNGAALLKTCKENDLIEKLPKVSNLHRISSSRSSTKWCCSIICKSSFQRSSSQTKRFLLQTKFQCHTFCYQQPMSEIKLFCCKEIENNCRYKSFKIPKSSQLSNQNFVQLLQPTFLRIRTWAVLEINSPKFDNSWFHKLLAFNSLSFEPHPPN